MALKAISSIGLMMLLATWQVAANQAPIITKPIPDQHFVYGEAISLDLTQGRSTFSDPDRERLNLSVTFSNDIGLTAGNRMMQGTINKVQNVVVSVTATDPAGARVTAQFNIFVTIDQDSILSQFRGAIDLTNLDNYANQTVPHYIGAPRDNNNPVTDAGATLGRVLFYDKKLSINITF
jgi:cytochrome c peroxidase